MRLILARREESIKSYVLFAADLVILDDFFNNLSNLLIIATVQFPPHPQRKNVKTLSMVDLKKDIKFCYQG